MKHIARLPKVSRLLLCLFLLSSTFHAAPGRAWLASDDAAQAASTEADLDENHDFTNISSGSNHACAVVSDGRVKCWGTINFNGQYYLQSAKPEYVPGLSDVISVSAGDYHTCALTTSGGVKCWGFMYSEGNNIPVDITGLTSGVKSISAGPLHNCAVLSSGAVVCWPSNEYYVDGLTSGVTAIATGGVWYLYYPPDSRYPQLDYAEHTCAVVSGGGVKCWGWGYTSTPMDVIGVTGATAIAVSGEMVNGSYVPHNCLITSEGGLKCWEGKDSPDDVIGLSSGVVAVDIGGFDTCVLLSGGEVKCLQHNVPGLSTGVVAITVGEKNACAIMADGLAKCWGSGSLGDEPAAFSTVPVDVFGLNSSVTSVLAYANHTFAGVSNGGLKVWGTHWNEYSHNTAYDIFDMKDIITAIFTGGLENVGEDHSCMLLGYGGVKCWGDNGAGQLGDGTDSTRYTPVDVVSLTSGVVAIAVGDFHNCAITPEGKVKCWGNNWKGQLGDGTDVFRYVPVEVNGLAHTAIAISAGESQTCALLSDGGVKCWGSNIYGELGIGTKDDGIHPTPVDVKGLSSGVTAIASRGARTCAAISDGKLKCWGGFNSSNEPVEEQDLKSSMKLISFGDNYTCVLLVSGGVKCWGDNRSGQLGDGTTTNSDIPVVVVGLSSGVKYISSGYSHSCALLDSGALKCWGSDADGQLGIGKKYFRKANDANHQCWRPEYGD